MLEAFFVFLKISRTLCMLSLAAVLVNFFPDRFSQHHTKCKRNCFTKCTNTHFSRLQETVVYWCTVILYYHSYLYLDVCMYVCNCLDVCMYVCNCLDLCMKVCNCLDLCMYVCNCFDL